MVALVRYGVRGTEDVMSLAWIHEDPPKWDAPKARIIGGAPRGAFAHAGHRDGDLLPGEWWRAEDGGAVVGYGWMDTTWGDAEVLLAVDATSQGRGVGSFILDRLEVEASQRGLNYLYNAVRDTHPERSRISRWLQDHEFEESGDGLLRRRVRSRSGF